MEFDKTAYRIRRQQNLRGQPGLYIRTRGVIFYRRDAKGYPIVGAMPFSDVGNKPVSKKAHRKNTKRARKAALHG